MATKEQIEAAAMVIGCSEYWLEPEPQETLESAWGRYCEDDKERFRKTAEAALEAAEAAAWQPIETVPKNIPVLICNPSIGQQIGLGKFVKSNVHGYWIDESTGRALKTDPSHWRNVPPFLTSPSPASG